MRFLRFLTHNEDRTNGDRAERLDIYKLMVEMADRVSQRRQTANSFYLSINTLLVGGSAYLGTTTPSKRTTIFISLAGTMACFYWLKSIDSYKTLNAAKFKVINKIETKLVEAPFTDEWRELDPDLDGHRHKPFHRTEKLVPKLFIAIYVFQLAEKLPWESIYMILCAAAK